MSGRRMIVGTIVMGIATPLTIFFLLGLSTVSQFFTIAAATFLAWALSDLLATILEKPRLHDRSARRAIDEEWQRRAND